MAPSLAEAIAVAARKAFVILDGTLLRINRTGMTGGRDRPYYWSSTAYAITTSAPFARPGPRTRLRHESRRPGSSGGCGSLELSMLESAQCDAIIQALYESRGTVVEYARPHPGRASRGGRGTIITAADRRRGRPGTSCLARW
jgi:hypothetical protein